MGSSASKASRTARLYPKTAPKAVTNPANSASVSQPRPTAHPQPPRASETTDEATDLDAADSALVAHLRTLGPVSANPYTSNSSTALHEPQRRDVTAADFAFGPSPYAPPPTSPVLSPPHIATPALAMLSARERLATEAEREFADRGRRNAPGRRFLDVVELRRVLLLRDEHGRTPAEIERQLGLREGVVHRLGPRGVVEAV